MESLTCGVRWGGLLEAPNHAESPQLGPGLHFTPSLPTVVSLEGLTVNKYRKDRSLKGETGFLVKPRINSISFHARPPSLGGRNSEGAVIESEVKI